jgi:type VI secretion system secreted protein VgrG
VPFRPARTTPRPKIAGSQTAVVVGPGGEEIYTDEYGRVKVQFHWDRLGKHDENSSCWMRVSQVHAGKNWGHMDLPRIGEEVIVSFLEGDPDRPIITGRVYNGANMPPFALPANKKRRGNMTKTYLGTGFNEMSMDDTPGKEQVRVHAQYNMDSVINNNQTQKVGVDRTADVGNNETNTVGVDRTTTVGNNEALKVGANQSVSVGDNIVIEAGTSITLVCGASRIHMNQAGIITINGLMITIAGTAMVNTAAPIVNAAGTVVTSTGVLNVLTGGALANVAGATTRVVALGDNIVKGGTVKINT